MIAESRRVQKQDLLLNLAGPREMGDIAMSMMAPNALPEEQMQFRSELEDRVVNAILGMSYPVR